MKKEVFVTAENSNDLETRISARLKSIEKTKEEVEIKYSISFKEKTFNADNLQDLEEKTSEYAKEIAENQNFCATISYEEKEVKESHSSASKISYGNNYLENRFF